MNLDILTAVVVAAFAALSTLAAGEASDTWSTIEPVQQSSYSVPQSATGIGPPAPALQTSWEPFEDAEKRFEER